MLLTTLAYCAAGCIAGILAGLFGIGGGLVIIPMLIYVFSFQDIPYELTMHLALATSMATIVFTSISSFMAHHRRGVVNWIIVRRISLGIVIGTFSGSCLVASMSTQALKIFFILFLYFITLQMVLNRQPKGERDLPNLPGLFAVGNGIGMFSSFVGIGGGTMSVPFMLWCNIHLHQAIGTSAAIGLPIALAGTAGYIFNGWGAENLPIYSFGYVYLPALLGVALMSVITAPLGVKLAHCFPVIRLKRLFSILLFVIATKMLLGVLSLI